MDVWTKDFTIITIGNGEYIYMMVWGCSLLGELVGGVCSQFMNERILLTTVMLIEATAAIIIIGGSRKHVEKIYNRAQ